MYLYWYTQQQPNETAQDISLNVQLNIPLIQWC